MVVNAFVREYIDTGNTEPAWRALGSFSSGPLQREVCAEPTTSDF